MKQAANTNDNLSPDEALFCHIEQIIRPCILPTDIISSDSKSITFGFNDPCLGRIELRAYAHEGAAVLACWESDINFETIYIRRSEVKDQGDLLALYKKKCEMYLRYPHKYYEQPALDSWRYIESRLADFITKFGALYMIDKIFNATPCLNEDEQIKLLSYLNLTDKIRIAKEKRAMWDASLPQSVTERNDFLTNL